VGAGCFFCFFLGLPVAGVSGPMKNSVADKTNGASPLKDVFYLPQDENTKLVFQIMQTAVPQDHAVQVH
jgi:hypothetical protein